MSNIYSNKQNALLQQISDIKKLKQGISRLLFTTKFLPYKHAEHLKFLEGQLEQLSNVYNELVKDLQEATNTSKIPITCPAPFLHPEQVEQVADYYTTMKDVCNILQQRYSANGVPNFPQTHNYTQCSVCGSAETFYNCTAPPFALCIDCGMRLVAVSKMEDYINSQNFNMTENYNMCIFD